MSKYEIAINRDTTHDGPQWWAEVLDVVAPGTEVEDVQAIFATTWHATEEAAEREARDWLWEHHRCRPSS